MEACPHFHIRDRIKNRYYGGSGTSWGKGPKSGSDNRPKASPGFWKESGINRNILASRIFAGPYQYPPASYSAYGIMAFPKRATDKDMDRHTMFCDAFVSALPNSTKIGTPTSKQMVTVWPVANKSVADRLNKLELASNICPIAVRTFHFVASLQAIQSVGKELLEPHLRGPFLIAWSPGSSIGDRDRPVLIFDLSDVDDADSAARMLLLWREEIQMRPELWVDGWNIQRLRSSIAVWADRYGEKIFKILENF